MSRRPTLLTPCPAFTGFGWDVQLPGVKCLAIPLNRAFVPLITLSFMIESHMHDREVNGMARNAFLDAHGNNNYDAYHSTQRRVKPGLWTWTGLWTGPCDCTVDWTM